MMMRLSSWLPGISAAQRLGLSEFDDEPSPALERRLATRETNDNARPPARRLPERDDSFYWALMHSHL